MHSIQCGLEHHILSVGRCHLCHILRRSADRTIQICWHLSIIEYCFLSQSSELICHKGVIFSNLLPLVCASDMRLV